MAHLCNSRAASLSPFALQKPAVLRSSISHSHNASLRRQRPRRIGLDLRSLHCQCSSSGLNHATLLCGCCISSKRQRHSRGIRPLKSSVDDDRPLESDSEQSGDRWPELDTWRRQGLTDGMVNAMLAAPFAAASLRGGASGDDQQALFEDVGKNFQQQELERFQAAQKQKPGFSLNSWLQDSDVPLLRNLQKAYAKLHDKVYYAEVLPPVYSRLSYARMMSLLYERRIKRITLLNEGRVAIVEIPFEIDMDPSLPEDDLRQDQRDPDMVYRLSEEPEWTMDKERFYVELPGDFWLDQQFMGLVKLHQPGFRDENLRTPYNAIPIEEQTHPELQVLDPAQFNAFWADNIGLFLWIGGVLVLRVVVGIVGAIRRLFGTKKTKMELLAEEFGKHRAKQFNMGSVKMETGVKYDDVAGIESIKDDLNVMMDMVMGRDAKYYAAGARPPRGVLLEGPPGTGKTYLAKAMAGQYGIPFFSANGAEFVEMFAGIAAARVRDLFAAARLVAPAIIFIDEIDALGKAREEKRVGGEREAGLMQLLVEMDGFTRDDRVLVLGATNMAGAMDPALMRPGRFDQVISMQRPGLDNRFQILKHHSRNKQIVRDGDEKYESEAILHDVARLTPGYSGAELENLLNEAAILQVKMGTEVVDREMMMSLLSANRIGAGEPTFIPEVVRRRKGAVEAARVVALALTQGVPPIESVTLFPRAAYSSYIKFPHMRIGESGEQFFPLRDAGAKPNAVTNPRYVNDFESVAELLMPLYAPRAAEEVFFGRRGVTLETAQGVANAGNLAEWLVQHSTLHPRYRDAPVLFNMTFVGAPDPTTEGLDFQPEIYEIQKAAHRRAIRLILERRPAINALMEALLAAPGCKLWHADIISVIGAAPLADVDEREVDKYAFPGSGGPRRGTSGRLGFWAGRAGKVGVLSFRWRSAMEQLRMADGAVQRAAEVLVGRLDLDQLIGRSGAERKAEQVQRILLDAQVRDRLLAMSEWRNVGDPANPDSQAPFPPAPAVPEFAGNALRNWAPTQPDVLKP